MDCGAITFTWPADTAITGMLYPPAKTRVLPGKGKIWLSKSVKVWLDGERSCPKLVISSPAAMAPPAWLAEIHHPIRRDGRRDDRRRALQPPDPMVAEVRHEDVAVPASGHVPGGIKKGGLGRAAISAKPSQPLSHSAPAILQMPASINSIRQNWLTCSVWRRTMPTAMS